MTSSAATCASLSSVRGEINRQEIAVFAGIAMREQREAHLLVGDRVVEVEVLIERRMRALSAAIAWCLRRE